MENVMDELVEWYRACLDDDERAAQIAMRSDDLPGKLRSVGEEVADLYGDPNPPEDEVRPADRMWWIAKDAANWVERHDPAAVLADIAAKRAILDAHTPTEWPTRAAAVCPTCARWDFDNAPEDAAAMVDHPCPTMCLLASAYRHRPGWKDEWDA